MGWNGSGSVNRTDGVRSGTDVCQQAEAAGVNIEADLMDVQLQDLADAIENCIAKDGQTTATANIPMGGYVFTGVGNGTARTNFLSVAQFQDSGPIFVGTTGGSANAQTASATPAVTAYTSGLIAIIRVGTTNTGSATFNLNSVGAATIYRQNGSTLLAGDLTQGDFHILMYDGDVSGWRLMTGKPRLSAALGLTATGTVQADALALTSDWNEVSTTASGTGVKLPAAATGSEPVFVRNNGANTLKVWPASGDQIDGLSVDANTTLSAGSGAFFLPFSSTRYISK